MNLPTLDQFAGCLLGQCLGDALGFPVEGKGPEWCRFFVEESLSPLWSLNLRELQSQVRLPGRGKWSLGQYSDDSQLAREMLQSFVHCQGFSPGDFGLRIGAIFDEGRIVGRGRATESAARRLHRGVPWQSAGEPAPAAGNGSAMRAAPIGLLFHSQPELLIQKAIEQGRMTHQDPRCGAGSVAIAGAVALNLRPGSIQTEQWVAELAQWTEQADAGFAEEIRNLTSWLQLEPEEAVRSISRAGLKPDFQDSWPGISPFVVGSVVWSLYSFLRHPKDYRGAVETAIAVGGDVDTTAAMTGAISGARVGLNALPQGLIRLVHDQGTWGFSELMDLARRCLVCLGE